MAMKFRSPSLKAKLLRFECGFWSLARQHLWHQDFNVSGLDTFDRCCNQNKSNPSFLHSTGSVGVDSLAVENVKLVARTQERPWTFNSLTSGSGVRRISTTGAPFLANLALNPATSTADTSAPQLSFPLEDPKTLLTAKQSQYAVISNEMKSEYFGEGVAASVEEEFKASGCGGVLVRECMLELLSKLEKVMESKKKSISGKSHSTVRRNHFLLEGPPGSGKTFALTTAVMWARASGWLVLHVPAGRDWTRGSLYYKHPDSSLWDTPLQAKKVLEGFLRSHHAMLSDFPLQSMEPITLGEGPGVGLPRGAKEVKVESGWSLKDLVQLGISNAHASVSALVRVRSELGSIQDVPVMIAVDEYNSWFTFSQYLEVVGQRSQRPIHANELRMVNAFRPMVNEGVDSLSHGIILAAMSESIAIGHLPQQLPGVPRRVRFTINGYSATEAHSALLFYQRRLKDKTRELQLDEARRLYYITNGNGQEIRTLSHLVL